MNRFERLFFILEKNPAVSGFDNQEVRGVVKIILTAEQLRVMWEISGLPVQSDLQYAIGIFLQKEKQQQLQPKYFSFQPNAYGNARLEKTLQYQLQEGETVFGVALSALHKSTEQGRIFPFVAFQNMRVPWQAMLEELIKQEQPKPIEKKTETKEFFNEFISCDPFGTTNFAYRWWKCTDMHQLNQALSKMELSLPLELNKDGYLACGLFGHVLLGLYTDKTLQREFFILGIPAKNKNDMGNYYSHSRWEGIGKQTVPEQEETGYWLTYIDCHTAKVVKVV